jgi:hypothetical protein
MLKYLLLLSVCAFAQERAFTFTPDSDTGSYHWVQEENDKFGFDAIEDDNGDYSFRLSSYGRAITVYKLDTIAFGNVTFAVSELHEFEGGQTGKIFKVTFALTSQQATDIISLLEETKIDTIPTDKLVSGWSQGFDGITYKLQHKKDSLYTLKKYWSPAGRDGIPEAALINDFQSRVNEIATTRKYYETFRRIIPFPSYSDGSIVVARVLTKKAYRDFKRRKRQYGKSNGG